jgi:hypothetical protein
MEAGQDICIKEIDLINHAIDTSLTITIMFRNQQNHKQKSCMDFPAGKCFQLQKEGQRTFKRNVETSISNVTNPTSMSLPQMSVLSQNSPALIVSLHQSHTLKKTLWIYLYEAIRTCPLELKSMEHSLSKQPTKDTVLSQGE